VRSVEPNRILLDCGGIIKVWREFFSGSGENAAVVSVGSRSTLVCLAEDGRLINAVSLDIGLKDFSALEGSAEQTETAERLAQDMRSVLELFGCVEPTELPIFVLSDGSSAMRAVVSCLASAGLKAEAALPKIQRSETQGRLSVQDVYEYRVPIGLGLCAFQTRAEQLNIFERLYTPAVEEGKKRWLYSPKMAGVVAAVMLVVLLVVIYLVDVASLNAIERHLKGPGVGTSGSLHVQRQKLIKTVALQRPNVLQLMSEINASGAEGVMLDSLHFKKGRAVTISGRVQNAEQLYKFQKSLLDNKGINEVKIQKTAKDSKSGKLTFTITFHYKNFTKKTSRT
jgi:hypothetical protein